MRRASDRLHPVVRAVYGASPIIDMHTRIKVGLRILGIIENASPRLPLIPVKREIEETIRAVIKNSELAKAVQSNK
jgi:4-hydroxy-tetrahydrodipicolinate synthase